MSEQAPCRLHAHIGSPCSMSVMPDDEGDAFLALLVEEPAGEWPEAA